jgi:CBS domain containing-hemolysin-like protein
VIRRGADRLHVMIPMDPPDLLPGRSAFDWTRIGVLASLAVVVVIFLAAAFAPTGLRETAITIAVLIGAFVAAPIRIWAAIAGPRTEIRELGHGYTTLFGKNYDHWQLESRTGKVLRRPGERQYARNGMPKCSATLIR